MQEQRTDWHDIFQGMMEDVDNLRELSGKVISAKAREYQQQIRIDFVVHTEGDIPGLKPIIRPFSHFKRRNLIEFKTTWESLNEKMLRRYIGRALDAETTDDTDYQGDTTLTILTLHKPHAVLSKKQYRFEEITPWKYRSHYDEELDVYVLVQNNMRKLQEGEAMALLQVIESNKDKQNQVWNKVLSQNLDNLDKLKKIIERISGGALMNIIQEAKNQGIKEGEIRGEIRGKKRELLKVLGWMAPELVEKYHSAIENTNTEEELEHIENKIRGELERK